MQKYDYSQSGYYFVTICAKNRECIFSKINNGSYVGAGLAPAQNKNPAVKLTIIGKIIDKHWRDIPNKYENVNIDEYMIMPNHMHGILIIRATARVAPTYLGQIIGSFKSRSADDYLKYINKNGINKSAKIWQRNYYDHIIRNEKSLYTMRVYIKNNPLNWQFDVENPQ